MGKTRKHNRHLPRRMYISHGAYFFVDAKNKWHPLGRDYTEALKRYATKIDVSEIIDVNGLISKYELEILPDRSPEHQVGRKHQFKRIRKAFGHMRPEDVTQADCWKYYEAAKMTSEARHEIAALSAVMGCAVRRWGVLKIHPLLKMDLPGQTPRSRYVTDAEYVLFRPLLPRMHRLAMDMTYITAMRQKDILSLERGQWTDEGVINLPSKTKHRGGKRLAYPMSDSLKATIEAALAIEPRVRRYIFCSTKGKTAGQRFTRDGFQSSWQRAMRKAIKTKVLIETFTFHDVRAKSISDAETLEQGRQRAGHTDARITDRVYRRLPQAVTTQDISRLVQGK